MEELLIDKISNEMKGYYSCEGSCEKIKAAARYHYQSNEMDQILAPFIGKADEFVSFLENEWGWKVSFDRNSNILIADENKPYCVCPLNDDIKCGKLCNCSEGFAELMFSKVFRHPVHARVKASVLRGDKSCIYEIML